MRKVVVAVDGSAASLRALERLLAERECYRKPDELEIHLLNAQHPLPKDIGQFIGHEQIRRYHHDGGEQALRQAQEALGRVQVPYTPHIGVGDPAEVIVRYARDNGCDCIVMGTRGLTDAAGLLVGSVTHKVRHLAECAVLLVK